MSKVRNSDIRSELRPSAQLLKLTYTAASETAFEKFDRQCIKKYRGKWKSRNTVAEEKAIVRSDGSILRILVVRCEDGEEENATGLLWLHDGGYAYGVPEQESLLVDMFCQVLGTIDTAMLSARTTESDLHMFKIAFHEPLYMMVH